PRAGPTVGCACPASAMGVSRARHHRVAMQSITPPRPAHRTPLGSLVTDTVLGTLLIVAGVSFGVLIVATPLLTAIMPTGRLGADQMAFGMAIWGGALVPPAGALLLGTSRLVRILGTVRRRLPG